MKKLIIAEKPSLGSAIANAIGGMKRKDGYFENDEYIVTFAFGHLFTLYDIEDYMKTEKGKWRLDDIPYYPAQFQFMLKNDSGVKKQFNIIKSLVNHPEVSEIVNCGDADREGEVIIRLIIMFVNNKKPVKRLWLPDQMPITIKQGLKNLKDDSEYDNLFNAGLCRMYMDWMYGINLTRYASIKANGMMSVGRVITAMVKAIYDRNMERKSFIPEQYFKVKSETNLNDEIITLTHENKFKTKEEAIAFANELNKNTAKVINIEKKEEKKGSGKLFSLSKLQGLAGKKYKMEPSETLAIVQELYEAGYLTYPRTNSEYLATAEKDRVQNIINTIDEGNELVLKDSKRIFNDDKIESHSAITPTSKLCDLTTLTEKQAKIYNIVLNRFKAAFCAEDCIFDVTTCFIQVGNEDFKITGKIIKQKGWMKFEASQDKDAVLPNLVIGQTFNVNFLPEEKTTEPPKKYTVETFAEYLMNPFKKDTEDNDDEFYANLKKGLEIGTEATRASIIDRAIKLGYIKLENNTYDITELGVSYVEILNELCIDVSAEKTVEFQSYIQAVYNSEIQINEAINHSKEKIDACLIKREEPLSIQFSKERKEVGNCPICGKIITENKVGFGCSGYKDNTCKFFISKKAYGGKISAKQASLILNRGYSDKLKLTSKTGKKYEARIGIKEDCTGLELLFD